MGLCLAIVSGKGGTGKSTVSCGLAVSFSRKGKSVAIIDLDKGLRCIDNYFGIEQNVVLDLSDAFSGADYSDVFYPVPNEKDIFVVPSPGADAKILPEDFADFLEKCKSAFDVVILDLSAGLDFEILSKSSGIKYICVSNQDPISVKDAAAVKNSLNNIRPLLIINKFDIVLLYDKKYGNIDNMIDNSGIQLLGIIPETPEMKRFPLLNRLKKRGRTIRALDRISGRLLGEKILLPKPENI